MRLYLVLFMILGFILGLISSTFISANKHPVTTTTFALNQDYSSEDDGSFVTRILGGSNSDKPSPYDRISESRIRVEKDKVTIDVSDAQWARFTDTNSMDPVLDQGANAIQIIPKSYSEIYIGDIVSYKSEYAQGTIIHRVVDIGFDEEGWYAILKGDNNPRQDPGKIRFSQIKRVLVAIIY